MTLPRRAVVHRKKIPYHLKKAKLLRIKLNDRELGNEQSIYERKEAQCASLALSLLANLSS